MLRESRNKALKGMSKNDKERNGLRREWEKEGKGMGSNKRKEKMM